MHNIYDQTRNKYYKNLYKSYYLETKGIANKEKTNYILGNDQT